MMAKIHSQNQYNFIEIPETNINGYTTFCFNLMSPTTTNEKIEGIKVPDLI